MIFILTTIAAIIGGIALGYGISFGIQFVVNLRADQYRRKTLLIEKYDDLSARFLKKIEGKGYHVTEDVVLVMACVMQHKRLAKYMFFSRREEESPKEKKRILTELSQLTREEKDLISELLGLGLRASTYLFPFTGQFIRRTLSTGLSYKRKATAAPERAVLKMFGIPKEEFSGAREAPLPCATRVAQI